MPLHDSDKETTKVNAIPYENREEEWDSYENGFDGELPNRRRRQLFNKWSALLFALILGGAGFYAGVRVEKGQLSTSSPAGFASSLASRFGRAGTGTTGATGATGRSGTGTTGSSGAPSTSGGAGRFGAGGFSGLGGLAGGSATVGSVSSVDGNTIYVTDTSGNTVKVTLSSATKITKSQAVSKAKVYPGDSVVISGVKGSNGSISATNLTDSGASSTGSSTSGSSGSGSSGSGLSSLFGG